MNTPTEPNLIKVVFVDDEPFVLEAFRRAFRKTFEATYVEGGQNALDLLHSDEGQSFSVVCTDMRMPSVDGIAVLKAFQDFAPDTTRMLLTGQADLETAVAAVNEGNVFRFLLKPTNAEQLQKAVEDGDEQRRLRLAECELLELTLRGSIQALVDTLSLANPVAFARAIRIRSILGLLLVHVDLPNGWEVEVAAMLSHVGAVSLPPDVSDALNRGIPFDLEAQEMVAALPELANQLLAHIPRLETVRELIANQQYWKHSDAPLSAKLVALATEIDTLRARSLPKLVVSQILEDRSEEFGVEALNAYSAMEKVAPTGRRILMLLPKDLRIGMSLVADVRTVDGLLLVGGGQKVSESLLARMVNFSKNPGLEQGTVAVYDD